MLKKSALRNQKGLSSVEMIPILLLFALMFNFSLGFFGVIHSGILNSIAARNYTFETFRNRPVLTYLRDIPRNAGTSLGADEQESRYTKVNYRFHGIISEGHGSNSEDWIVTRRPIKFTEVNSGVLPVGVASDHTQLVRQISDPGKVSTVFTGKTPDEGRSGVSPVWVQTLYGICLSSACKGT